MASTPEVSLRDYDLAKFYLLMPVGSATIRTIVYPVQLVKTRMQANAEAYRSTGHALTTIVRTEGARALYKGFFTNALSMLVGPIYVTTLEGTREVLRTAAEDGTLVLPPLVAKPVSYMASGLLASVVSQTAVVPIDNISQRLMVHQGATPLSPLAIARDIVAQRGVAGLYRGYASSLATYAPTSAAIWGVYALARHVCALVSPPPPPDARWPASWIDAVAVPLSGAFAGATAAMLTNPIDVVRTNLQLSDASAVSFRSTAAALYAQGGPAAFARGIVPRMTSIGVTMTFVMTFYEALKFVSVRRSDDDDDDDA